MKLLSRDNFRQQVFERDSNTCLFCDRPAVDAHHIMERRLWPDGGYYLENGASVCAEHHIACEKTDISVEQILEKLNIKRATPPHLYDDHIYDKWGNCILENGKRTKGELFYDESVQKILSNHSHEFTDFVKYPRTYHLPWSEGLNADDRMMPSIDHFEGRRVVVTEKLDGENTTMYNNGIHARSLDGRNHPSRNWVKNFWSGFAHDIPNNFRICGENMFAKHSISYTNLESYFYGFSIWVEQTCLSWNETQEWFELFGITSVPVLYDGIFDSKKIKSLWKSDMWNSSEGYVLRVADNFNMKNFNTSVGKFVRKNHIQTIKHWMYGQEIEKNELK